jgi:hypothetical protein
VEQWDLVVAQVRKITGLRILAHGEVVKILGGTSRLSTARWWERCVNICQPASKNNDQWKVVGTLCHKKLKGKLKCTGGRGSFR